MLRHLLQSFHERQLREANDTCENFSRKFFGKNHDFPKLFKKKIQNSKKCDRENLILMSVQKCPEIGGEG